MALKKAKGTIGEGAELHFQHVEANIKCFGCGGALSFDDQESICAYYQDNNSLLSSGEDVKLESMEVE